MKFYLSSYRLGNEIQKLKKLLPKNKRVALVTNAADAYSDTKLTKTKEAETKKMLSTVGFEVEKLDLRNYFGKKEILRKKIKGFGSIWVKGGNCFVLRQAMKLSGFDEILISLLKTDMVYGGSSAGVCVLAPSLKGIHLVDQVNVKPYKSKKTIWEGLGILDYAVVPHYRSDHKESKDVEKVVQYYIDNKILFRVLRDGDVIIIEQYHHTQK